MVSVIVFEKEMKKEYSEYEYLFSNPEESKRIRIFLNSIGEVLLKLKEESISYEPWRLIIIRDFRESKKKNPFLEEWSEITHLTELAQGKEIMDTAPNQIFLIGMVKEERFYYEEENKFIKFENELTWDAPGYPPICRFLISQVGKQNTIKGKRQYFKFLCGVLTLALNEIPGSLMQAYTLYSLKVDLDRNRLYQFLDEIKKETSKLEEKILCMEYDKKFRESIAQNPLPDFNSKYNIGFLKPSVRYLKIHRGFFGLFKDTPMLDEVAWEKEMESLEKYVPELSRSPRQILDNGIKQASKIAEINNSCYRSYTEEQIGEVKRNIERLETEIFSINRPEPILLEQWNERKKRMSEKILKFMEGRLNKNRALVTMWGSVGIYVITTCFPSALVAMQRSCFGRWIFMVVGVGLVTVLSGLLALFFYKKKLENQFKEFDNITGKILKLAYSNRDIYERYLSAIYNYMKCWNFLEIFEQYKQEYSKQMKDMAYLKSLLEWKKSLLQINKIYSFPLYKTEERITLYKKRIDMEVPYPFVTKLIIERKDGWYEL